MRYYLTPDFIFNYGYLKNHYLGVIVSGDFGETSSNNFTKIIPNTDDMKKVGHLATVAAFSLPILGNELISYSSKSSTSDVYRKTGSEGEYILFKLSDFKDMKIIGRDPNYGVSLKNGIIFIVDYGTRDINLLSIINSKLKDGFVNERPIITNGKYAPSSWLTKNTSVVYSQTVFGNMIINSINYKEFFVGDIKVNLNGLELTDV